MPELPEVETICRGLRPHLAGRRIIEVQVLERRLRHLVDERLAERLQWQKITAVCRRSKYILIYLQKGLIWVLHLGMSGKLIHVDAGTPNQKHDHIIVNLDSGRQLRYHDPRRFGLSLLATEQELETLPQFNRLGLDPFDGKFDEVYLYSFTRKSARRIRDLLLDQQVVAGIGNIYANEILKRVGVRPTARSFRLTREKTRQLAATTRTVLEEAIRWCGTSFSDYRDADDKFGEFQNHLRVYDREGEKCRDCPGVIKRVALGNRGAFYCPRCQR
ncbi:MAG: bifunctional DNA-formamidopyrimidine glycosylase/DNA-(apurinic or apyrimidinic site) lyase [Deltaproteobacteria bacterium]|nr:bifunctional DNA-formamidopyrimidine glycosylase/DNA-(apurinic or apyrimidinic site) lyase [Deltaproteobacteria bacterium]